jgi:formylglycine-generating enzyme required for sulfatase activity
MLYLKFLLYVKLFSIVFAIETTCSISKFDYYGTLFCNKITQNNVKPNMLSQSVCFKGNITFKMGTDDPIFKSDGEAPARTVRLKSFCIDQTEVSNFQFLEFVKETKYRTEVLMFRFKFIQYFDFKKNFQGRKIW